MDKEKMNGCGCGCNCSENEIEHENEGCGCGCGEHEHEHEALIVDLEDENGNVVPCEVVDGFTYKENEYVLVQNPEDGAVYLFKVVGEGDEAELTIPEDEEFEEVSAYYEKSLEESEEESEE